MKRNNPLGALCAEVQAAAAAAAAAAASPAEAHLLIGPWEFMDIEDNSIKERNQELQTGVFL